MPGHPVEEAGRNYDRGPRGAPRGLGFLRAGTFVMVTRIDRLARSIGDLQDIVRTVRARGAALKATEQPIDTGTAAGKCFLDMLGVFAEFETQPTPRAPAGRHRQGESGGGLQGSAAFHRGGSGARDEGAGYAAGRHR
jgi:hypothetical protein